MKVESAKIRIPRFHGPLSNYVINFPRELEEALRSGGYEITLFDLSRDFAGKSLKNRKKGQYFITNFELLDLSLLSLDTLVTQASGRLYFYKLTKDVDNLQVVLEEPLLLDLDELDSLYQKTRGSIREELFIEKLFGYGSRLDISHFKVYALAKGWSTSIQVYDQDFYRSLIDPECEGE